MRLATEACAMVRHVTVMGYLIMLVLISFTKQGSAAALR